MISMNQMIAGGQAMQWNVSVRPLREAAWAPTAPTVQEPGTPDAAAPADDAAATSGTGAPARPGRAHIQQDVHHLAKAVRKSMHAEMREMKQAGTWTPERAAALREMGGEFLSDLHDAFQGAGRGREFDGGKVPEGVRQAMISLTDKLKAFNGTEADDAAAPAGEGADAPTPKPDPLGPEGLLVDTLA
jgi:hypothetical protein